VSTGTLGGLLDAISINGNTRTFALTNRHVVATLKVNDDVFVCNRAASATEQPEQGIASSSQDELAEYNMKPIGQLRTYIDTTGATPYKERPTRLSKTYDIALIELNAHPFNRSEYRRCKLIKHKELIREGPSSDIMQVQKTGCTTNRTYGRITETNCSQRIVYLDPFGNTQTADLHGVIEIENEIPMDEDAQDKHFAESGDSGAIIVAENGTPNNYVAIGMFTFYSNDNENNNQSRAYAFPIYDALAQLHRREPQVLGEDTMHLYAHI
ncbi:unnamed protein product, partial [Owenia fusiformis]